MQDELISRGAVITYALWGAVAFFILSAWGVVVFAGPLHIAGMLAATGCATSALAAVSHIRQYVSQVCAMLSVMRGERRPECRPAAAESERTSLRRL